MLQSESIVCISSIDWDFNWQGHQEIMSAFAQRGNQVLFIENTGIRIPGLKDLPRLLARISNWRRHVGGIREIQERLYVCSPVILPFPYSRLAGFINRFLLYRNLRSWSRLVGFKKRVVWTFLPTRISLDLIDALDPEMVVYYCIADFEALGPGHKVRRLEKELLKRADVVFAQGEFLAERCRQVNPDVSIFPFGVRSELFDGVEAAKIPADLEAIPRPRIGYVGALQRHVDFDLLNSLAHRHPEWSLVLVGPDQVQSNGLSRSGNVFWLGARSHEAIPSYMAHFDVCLIPYRLNRYTQTVYPTKLHEYLMLGKPVVSTALPEVIQFNQGAVPLVHIGEDLEKFETCVVKALGERDPELLCLRKEAAQLHSWENRIDQMSRILEERLKAKRSEAVSQWRTLLARAYRRARRRLLKVTASVLFGYALIFHTPLLWWVAEPLKLKDLPAPADAIVVFAGGVGESGQAGQGYEERVTEAVLLYQSGFSPRILFSSGYRYALNETDVMKALAVSLGVPAEALILERSAGNTKENVQFSADLLRKNGSRSALVVSSPYHMRRTALVWRKIAPDIKPIFCPIPYSHFFGDQNQVMPRHLLAILHEYLGIAYYWWKGWI